MNANTATILVCDDDPMCQETLPLAFGSGYQFGFIDAGDCLLDFAQRIQPDLILLDIRLRTEREGFSLLPRLLAQVPTVPVIIYSGSSDYESVKLAMQLGATDFIPKDSTPAKMRRQVDQAMQQQRFAEARPMAAADPACAFLGTSAKAQALRQLAKKFRDFPGNVILTGESGTGKEVVARMLRRMRDDGSMEPFVAVDSSTIQGNTAESALFGHERGAFTGAEERRQGLFELADGGVIYFDEIANMSMDIQAKLLRAIQEQEVVRLGAYNPIKLKFRVICASNRDLLALTKQGLFRRDLYERLNVFHLHIAPLRERAEDIPLFLGHYLAQHNQGVPYPVTDAALNKLLAYDWPGNVRELANTAQYLIAMADGAHIGVEHLPHKIDAHEYAIDVSVAGFHAQVKAHEREILTRAHQATAGNVSKMARRLGLDRSSLYRKLRDHDILPNKEIDNDNDNATTAR